MTEFQAIIDFSIQINKFINIDLFQRGFYQIRLSLKLPNCKNANKIELNCTNPNLMLTNALNSPDAESPPFANSNSIVFPPCVVNGVAVSKTFQIIYNNDEIVLNDPVLFRVNICLDLFDCMKQIEKTNFVLHVELWFTEHENISSQQNSIVCVSSRQLLIHFDLQQGIHYNLPVIFDYFHLSAVTLSIHACLVSICQPYIGKNEPSGWLANFISKQDEKRLLSQQSNTDGDKKSSTSLQIRRLQMTLWKLVSLIISSLLNLKKRVNEYYRLLAPWQQAKINFEALFVNISSNSLSKLSQKCLQSWGEESEIDPLVSSAMKLPESVEQECEWKSDAKMEDLLSIAEHDIAYMSGLTIDQWHRFLRLLASDHSDRINHHLAKIHHQQRIKRFSEGFFCIEKSRPEISSICDDHSSQFLEVSEMLRKSAYFSLLPPCEVECCQLDGDSTTLPIIFEEKYEIFDENAKLVNSNQNDSQLILPNLSGSFSSPSKYSISSSSTSSSNSSRSNIKLFFSKLNNVVNDNKKLKKELSSKQKNRLKPLQNTPVNTIDLLGIYGNELLKEDDNNNLDKMSRKIKLINSLFTRSSIMKSNTKLSLEYQERKVKREKKVSQLWLRNTTTPVESNHHGKQSEVDVNSRSWPNLSLNHDQSAKNDSTTPLLDSKTNQILTVSKSVTTDKEETQDVDKPVEKKDNKHKHSTKATNGVINHQDWHGMYGFNKQFKGTMYFPKPPKEFAMEEVDEPTEEVNSKPIPIVIDHQNQNKPVQTTITIDEVKLENLNLNENTYHLCESNTIKNSVSCQDLTTMANESETPKELTTKKFKDDIYLKSNNLNETKFTFMELLQSDHCLICCGTIKKQENESWPCTCRNSCQVKSLNASPPSFRRFSTVGSDFISFLHAKEDFRNQISKKVKNLLFYSDFHTLPSRIPYFRCNSDFKAYNPHRDLHLVVCVHGLDGNSADLRLIKTYLEIALPTNNFDFLMSQRNQGETFDNLDLLTERLVSEIDTHIGIYNLNPTRISFIGHSLGNIIIRAAIAHEDFMERWRDKLYTFLSLSGPHLGLAYNRSGLVNMGLWVIQKFKKAHSLMQLQMKDSTDIRQTYLYQLSLKPGLECFRNILLCGSSQDYYVPIHSAHIELCHGALTDNSDYGIAYREMAHNILQPLAEQRNLNLIRYEVNHALSNNTNALIGRAAHIAVLDSELFIEKFMVVAGLKYFV